MPKTYELTFRLTFPGGSSFIEDMVLVSTLEVDSARSTIDVLRYHAMTAVDTVLRQYNSIEPPTVSSPPTSH